MSDQQHAPPAPGAMAGCTSAPRLALALNDVVHQRVRLGILCVLGEIHRAEFSHLRQLLELSDGNLSSHLRVLVDAGHVVLTKDRSGSRPRTWVILTAAGRQALRLEVESLDRIVRAHRSKQAPSDSPGLT
jgi:DNA-binding transcriptional ArsR family regulator